METDRNFILRLDWLGAWLGSCESQFSMLSQNSLLNEMPKIQ